MGTRQLRTRKNKNVAHTPTILDDIVVCWELEGSVFWWPALVTELDTYDTLDGMCYGTGTLLYKQYKKYPAEEADVRFFYSTCRGHVLTQHYNGSLLEMAWSHPGCQNSGKQQASSDKQQLERTQRSSVPSKRAAEPISRRSKRSSIDGVKLETQRGSASTSDKKDTTANKDAVLPGAFSTEQRADASHAPSKQMHESISGGSTVNHVDAVNANALAMTTTKIIENVLGTSQHFFPNLSSSAFHAQMTSLVKHELRIDLVIELHRHFRTPQNGQKSTMGLLQRTLRTSVSCPLHTFSSMAKEISNNSKGDVYFFPDYSQTQNPSISAEHFTIYFKSIHSLSSALGFNDNRDFETLFFREKCHDNTYYARILGSLCLAPRRSSFMGSNSMPSFNTLVDKNRCTSSTSAMHAQCTIEQETDDVGERKGKQSNVDIIFVGLSQFTNLSDPVTPADLGTSSAGPNVSAGSDRATIKHEEQARLPNSSQSSAQLHTSPANSLNYSDTKQDDTAASAALVRKQTLWDEESHEYLAQWECRTDGIQTLPPDRDFFLSSARKLEGMFALRWERKHIPRTTAWTSDALRSDSHVLGKLDVLVPWVLLTGDQCVEVGDLLSKLKFKIRT